MVDNQIVELLLVAACGVGFGGGMLWQTLRRRKKPSKRRRVERIGARPVKIVSEEETAPVRPDAPVMPRHCVTRPTMLAFTTLTDSTAAADLYVQRALEADESYYRALPVSDKELETLNPLFCRNCILDWRPGNGLSHDIYAINFSKMLRPALAQGVMPHANVTNNDLEVIALINGAVPLGDSMSVEDHTMGEDSLALRLWGMVNPTDKKHELDALLEHELDEVRRVMPDTLQMLPALGSMKWKDRWDRLFDLTRDFRRIGAEHGRAEDRHARCDALVDELYDINETIDREIDTLSRALKTPAEAESALTLCKGFLRERELSVLFLRVLAVLRVIGGENYLHGMHCCSHIRSNLDRFPDAHQLLDRVRNMLLDSLETASRAMSDEELRLTGALKREADELSTLHTQIREELSTDVERLQTAIDRYLILQGRPRAYAVELNSDQTVKALLVLEH